MRRSLGFGVMAVSLIAIAWNPLTAQQPRAVSNATLRSAAVSAEDLRYWDQFLVDTRRSGAMRLRSAQIDPDIPAQNIERFDQYHDGVRIWGFDVVRHSDRGASVAIFGAAAPELEISTHPALDVNAARLALAGPDRAKVLTEPELVILPLPGGGFALAYTAAVATNDFDRIFVDAQTSRELWRYSELHTQSAIGTGTGVLGDTKKISVVQQGGTFVATDARRPPPINTFDMHGDLNKAKAVLGGGPLSASDLAGDADNVWTDPAAVDAHVYVGWTYDFFFKRFGRNGLDDRNREMLSMVNAVTQQGALLLRGSDINFAVNAAWCPVCGPDARGMMFFGNGIPPNVTFGGQSITNLAGALDIVAHELTHAVTSSTSDLIGSNESGALNESFSDMMGTSVEFYYRALNAYKPAADYVIGEDVVRAVAPGTRDGGRSMADPALYGDPDHYRNKYVGAGDGGGLHTNTGIPNQAFYLAIEGGTNRTSGLSVTGVGAANREQIEKSFYRAFTTMLPANATFVTARTATTQAARELYGAGSRAETAIDTAWNAVGVPDARSILTYSASAAAGTLASAVFTMTATGTYQVNLRGNDAGVDLDLYLTPNTTTCSTAPLPTSCILVRSITPEAVESVKWNVRTGESYRIWVENLGPRSSSFSVEHFVTP